MVAPVVCAVCCGLIERGCNTPRTAGFLTAANPPSLFMFYDQCGVVGHAICVVERQPGMASYGRYGSDLRITKLVRTTPKASRSLGAPMPAPMRDLSPMW